MSMSSTTWVLNITLPANTPAYTPVRATIVVPETGGSYTEFSTGNMAVIIDDAYVASSPSTDYVIRIVVDRRTIAAVSRAPASQLLANNPAKLKAFEPSIGVGPHRFITVEVLPLSNVGTSAVNHTAYLAVRILK